jgi:hypothetical protein
MDCIYYKRGYKYQLTRAYALQTGLPAPFDIVTEYIDYAADGTMTIRRGYAWDGPSGPALDTADAMRASLVHDAFYQLMREGRLNPAFYRKYADRLLRRLCLEDGMNAARADLWYEALRLAAGAAAAPENDKQEIAAPKNCPEVSA